MKRDEDALVRMIRDAGSPEAAGRGLIERLEALEASVAQLERRAAGKAGTTPANGEADSAEGAGAEEPAQ